MKKFTFSIALFFLLFQNAFADLPPGELWFLIHDEENTNYYVVARRISTSDPLFGINYMEVNTTAYDLVISDSDELVFQPEPPYNIRRGFDYLWDTGSHEWPKIGNGKLEFLIYRINPGDFHELIFRFKLNNLHSASDIKFKYSVYTGVMLAAPAGGGEWPVQFDEQLNSWELFNQQQNISNFVNDVELTNFLATGPEPNIKTIFTNAPMGFPDPNTQTGVQYNPGTVVPLWRGVFYGVTVSHTAYTKNNIVYNFRNWFNTDNYSSSTAFSIEDETDRFRSDFQPTHPLTVSGYFEGGVGINYQLTWQNPPLIQPWQFGNVFNAFKFEDPRNDEYTVTAPTPIQALGTTWYFRHWNDGSTSSHTFLQKPQLIFL